MQAREDARLAAATYAAQPAAGAADAARLLVPVLGRMAVQMLVGGAAGAHLRLGEALMALPGHPDRDAAGAAQVGPHGQQCHVCQRCLRRQWLAQGRVPYIGHANTACKRQPYHSVQWMCRRGTDQTRMFFYRDKLYSC